MRSKRVFAILFIIILIICIIIGFWYFKSNEKQTFSASLKFMEKIPYVENIEISLRENIPESKDYNKDFKNDIFWLDHNVQDFTKKIGTYHGLIISGYQLNFITLTVVDENPPIIQGVKDITITVGDKIDLEKQVTVIDDSNEEVSVIVKGEYSLEKEGSYPLTYEAKDSSGNVSTTDFKLIVKKKEVQNPSGVPTRTSKGYDIIQKNGAYYIKGILIANKTYALSKSYAPGSLTKETSDAFERMKADAAKEGISLKIISGYRSYSHQNNLYNNYVKRDGKVAADRYSARPGHSEHQTGLAFDVNSLEQSFGNTKVGKWLSDNCYKYGFILRYPKGKESVTGYMYEPWHFRYIGEEASKLYNNGSWITLEEYLGIDSKYSS